jgi:hypothetical protein
VSSTIKRTKRFYEEGYDLPPGKLRYKKTIRLLSLVNNRSLSHDEEQYIILRFSGLAADACSLSLQAGDDAFEALKLLELRCGVIIILLINNWNDISSLERSYP